MGTPSLVQKTRGYKAKPLVERLATKIVRRGPDECWLWTAAKDRRGYGRIGYRRAEDDKETWMGAHRATWIVTFGPVSNDDEVCHTCDEPSCCNPKHLFVGSHTDNMIDMSAKRRQVFQRHPERSPQGERNGQSKLTEDKVRQIRVLLSRRTPAKHVAKMFAVSHTLIQHIKHGRAWRHVA